MWIFNHGSLVLQYSERESSPRKIMMLHHKDWTLHILGSYPVCTIFSAIPAMLGIREPVWLRRQQRNSLIRAVLYQSLPEGSHTVPALTYLRHALSQVAFHPILAYGLNLGSPLAQQPGIAPTKTWILPGQPTARKYTKVSQGFHKAEDRICSTQIMGTLTPQGSCLLSPNPALNQTD